MIFQTKMFNPSHFASRAQISLTTCNFGGFGENINCAGHKIELHSLKHTEILKSGQVKKSSEHNAFMQETLWRFFQSVLCLLVVLKFQLK